MRTTGLKARLLADLAGVAGLLFLPPALAFSQTPFYQGKTITLLQSTQAGDTSDTMTRAIVPFLKKHIPGEPTIKLEFSARKWGNESRQPYLQQCAAGRSYYRPHRRRSGSQCRPARSGCSIRS